MFGNSINTISTIWRNIRLLIIGYKETSKEVSFIVLLIKIVNSRGLIFLIYKKKI